MMNTLAQNGKTKVLSQRKKLTKTQYISRMAILGAVAFLLMYIEIPLPIAPPWLKLDFSEIPVLLGAFALGPVAGVIIQGIKCLLFLLIHGSTSGGVGELANFLIGVALVLVAAWIYKNRRNFKFAIIGTIIGIVSASLVAGVLNYYVLIPFYASTGLMPMDAIIAACSAINPAADSLMGYVLIFAMPFTAVKLAIDAVVVFLLYPKLSHFLHH